MPVDIPVTVETTPPRRPSARSERNGMAEYQGAPKHPPEVDLPNGPDPAPRSYEDMSYKEPHNLRNRLGCPFRDARSLLITRLLTIDQLERTRAPDDPEAAHSARKNAPWWRFRTLCLRRRRK